VLNILSKSRFYFLEVGPLCDLITIGYGIVTMGKREIMTTEGGRERVRESETHFCPVKETNGPAYQCVTPDRHRIIITLASFNYTAS
jgi:hypothetical protein